MKNVIKTVVAAAAFGVAAPAAAEPAAVDALFERWSAADSPGCAVGVGRDGKAVAIRSYGAANLEHAVPIGAGTIFEAGSVSKQFTAAAILRLAEEGRLSLDDDVRRHIPELPDYGAPITIEHLLSHTSGLRDWGSVMELAGWPRMTRAYTPADVLDVIVRQRALNYAPGTEYSYTNSGYNLMAEIVRRVSGQTLAEFTRERLFVPLAMTSTSWRDDFRRVVPGRATAYERDEASWAQAMPFEDAYGNGGLLTTVGDLLLWNEALAGGRLGAFVTEALQERAALSDGSRITYARGLFVDEHRGHEEISHSGSTAGYRAWLARYPASRLSVAVLCNAGNAPAADLGRGVADAFLAPAAPEPQWAAPAAGSAAKAGLFASRMTGLPLRLAAVENGLRIKDGPALEPLGESRFRLDRQEIAFSGDDRFRVTGPTGGSEYVRVKPWAPAPSELAAFAGRYFSDEAGAAWLMTVDEGGLRATLERRPEVTAILEPLYRDAFAFRSGILRFRRDAAGRPVAFGAGIPRVRDLQFERSGEAGPAGAQPSAGSRP